MVPLIVSGQPAGAAWQAGGGKGGGGSQGGREAPRAFSPGPAPPSAPTIPIILLRDTDNQNQPASDVQEETR